MYISSVNGCQSFSRPLLARRGFHAPCAEALSGGVVEQDAFAREIPHGGQSHIARTEHAEQHAAGGVSFAQQGLCHAMGRGVELIFFAERELDLGSQVMELLIPLNAKVRQGRNPPIAWAWKGFAWKNA